MVTPKYRDNKMAVSGSATLTPGLSGVERNLADRIGSCAQGAYIGSYRNDINSAPLYTAINKENWETVLVLIEHGALDYWNNIYTSPLGVAVDNEAPVEIIEAMLENGADVDGEYRAMLPLELCIRNRMWDHAALLLANDATVYRYFYELAEKRNAPRSFLNQLRAAYREQGVPME